MVESFTPAPWKWWTSNSWRRLRRDDRNSAAVLEPFVARDGHPDCSVSEADAHLIAAAPDLYDALLGMMDVFCAITDDDQNEAWNRAEAALAKARGETVPA